MNIIESCKLLATYSEEAGCTTRTFLSLPMHEVHRELRLWMEEVGMHVTVDAAGNLRGLYSGHKGQRLIIGSHADTVPHAGAYDGLLGVVLGIALIGRLEGRRLPFDIEVVAFSEEEGVRFGLPFIGSRALAGTIDSGILMARDANGISVSEAIRLYGLDPDEISAAAIGSDVFGYLEFHIEQGPVLESLDLSLGVVDAIVGQSRLEVCFHGQANHAGTTPMHLRHDALAAAAEWITMVENEAKATDGLVATVGRIEALPGAGNVIAGQAKASLDVRHASDETRTAAVSQLLKYAQQIAARRQIAVTWKTNLDHRAVPCDGNLRGALDRALAAAGHPVHHMVSGAGHDAMVLASRIPVAMLFLRSPGGISHHPGESVRPEDVSAAVEVGLRFLDQIEAAHA